MKYSPPATLAQVSYSGAEEFGATGATEHRGVPLCAPRGIHYRPCEGDTLLLLSAEGATVCAGALAPAQTLEPGELLLLSAGGARIHLKNNGEISLNGLCISPTGILQTP